jgi:hypothetical protein
MTSRNRWIFPTLAIGLGLASALAACSVGTSAPPAASSPAAKTSAAPAAASSSSPTAAGSPAPIGAQPSAGPEASASVKADWTAFFDPSTPIAERIALLQDGAKFQHYLEVQAQPGVAHNTTEQVTAVMVFGTQATVTYNIMVSGVTSDVLSNKSGQAMFSSGTWQVSDTDFCTLLTLENNGKTLPGC